MDGQAVLTRGGLALLFGTLFTVAMSVSDPERTVTLVLSNGGQLVAAAVASAACCRAAARSRGRDRRAWVFLAAATGSWAAGQAVWTFYEVVRDVAVPFPSSADIGFLLFPLLAVPGLLWWSSSPGRVAALGRDLLDGAIIAASLLVLSWSTTLGSVVADGGEGWLAVALSLAYPVGDIVVATVVIFLLGRAGTAGRAPLLLVAGGVGGLAVADSAYVYLVAVGSYSSGDLVSAGWVFGFLLIAAGATVPAPGVSVADDGDQAPTRLRMLLPYVPLIAAGASVCFRLATADVTPLFDLGLGVVLVTLVLLRQFLAMNENHRLLGELEKTRDLLRHQTMHDSLTGLANRVLLADRVDHALAQRAGDVDLLYCDLDDFKSVNDELGHQAGDDLLRIVAQRLLECVRPADTVARLGGDEFAVLLEDSSGATQVAERIVASVQQPCRLGDRLVRTTVSVGVAHHHAGRPTGRDHLRALGTGEQASAEQLMRQADSAMYVAKATGKDQAVHAKGPPMPDADAGTPLADSSAS